MRFLLLSSLLIFICSLRLRAGQRARRPGSPAIIPNLCLMGLYPSSRGSAGRCSNVTFSGAAFFFLSIHYPPGLKFSYSLSPNRKNEFLECKHLGVLCVYYHISEPITVTVFFPMKESTYVSFLGQAGHKVSPAKICSGVLGTSHATFPDFSRRPGQ